VINQSDVHVFLLKRAFGAGHRVSPPFIKAGRFIQGPTQGFEKRLSLVVVVLPVQDPGVQVAPGRDRERFQEM
jgi:hypothetical protein